MQEFIDGPLRVYFDYIQVPQHQCREWQLYAAVQRVAAAPRACCVQSRITGPFFSGGELTAADLALYMLVRMFAKGEISVSATAHATAHACSLDASH